ncbi:hypothetical protein BASA81_003065 [Batrachochytrium salamandrivorans]|nr:hypothetical protein BASA81_003065 [Batrachochytrium salamandrivorans]
MRCKVMSPIATALRLPEEVGQDRLEVGFEDWVKLPASATKVHCPLASCLSLLFANHTVVDNLARELAVPSDSSMVWLRLCTTGNDDLFEGDGNHTWGKKIAPFLLWAFLFMGAVWFVCFFSTLLFWDGGGERAREVTNPTATGSGTIKKFCPRCRVLIQKIGGCDKMQCTGCGTRFSWAQAEVAFANSNLVNQQVPIVRDVEASPVSCSNTAPPRPVVLSLALQVWIREHEHYVRLGDAGGGEDGGDVVCVVCKDRRCDWRFQGCGHSMCQTCMVKVISASGRCPFDRTMVEAVPIPLV